MTNSIFASCWYLMMFTSTILLQSKPKVTSLPPTPRRIMIESDHSIETKIGNLQTDEDYTASYRWV